MPNRYGDAPDVKPATGSQSLPTGSGSSPLSDRRGKATSEAISHNDEPLPPPVDAQRIVPKDETEADSK